MTKLEVAMSKIRGGSLSIPVPQVPLYYSKVASTTNSYVLCSASVQVHQPNHLVEHLDS